MKFPEAPEVLETKFILFSSINTTHSHADTLNISDAHIINADGNGLQYLLDSNFDPRRPLKMIIHGYKGSGRDGGTLLGVDAFLKMENVNVITVDWEKGAAGPSLPSVSSEHRAGLDPASPIFKSQFIEPSRKLDIDDADFVDVVHTDGSPVWTDGFGLLRPLGHVDYFPNGGREQPGCNDGRASVVVSHFEGALDISIACSHIRAWRLFVESILQTPDGCQFMAYPCHSGLPSFLQGNCYPALQKCALGINAQACGTMGVNAMQSPGRGALYLVTRDSSPYCGEQLRATVYISEKTQKTRGILHMVLLHGNSTTNFQINCEFQDVVQGGRLMWGLAAAEFGTLGSKLTPSLEARLGYQSLISHTSESQDDNSLTSTIYLDKVSIADIHGNSWSYCGNTILEDNNQTHVAELAITLTQTPCLP
ncbi:hypothetical protein L9F63_001833 [Diploptera punctata]|uniref:Lipase domain-containing protein n=1 Tax=Diploptera punctata TaxID=6984 RepID=A0AAD8A331_DIPPU|nr:hypothetical protein L9F63_001833 [Diploptera punctata]